MCFIENENIPFISSEYWKGLETMANPAAKNTSSARITNLTAIFHQKNIGFLREILGSRSGPQKEEVESRISYIRKKKSQEKKEEDRGGGVEEENIPRDPGVGSGAHPPFQKQKHLRGWG